MEALKAKQEELTKQKTELTEHLNKLIEEHKLTIRNLDRIEGALFILNEQLEPKKESKATDTTTQNIETIEAVEESKH